MLAGRFREDLFYRLNVIPINLPPLRARHEDILPLATIFLARFGKEMGRTALRLSREAKQVLLNHPYPGNVRELKNAMERAAALCRESELTTDDLPPEFSGPHRHQQPGLLSLSLGQTSALAAQLDQRETELIELALKSSGNRRGDAAKLLGISRKTLWKKLKQHAAC